MSPLYSGAKLICRCLEISETDLLQAIDDADLRSLTDVIGQTGAGDGCTACRTRILEYLEQHRTLAAASR
ncbi:MAG: (2Fe-2S)-binding protein [Pirellulales bacterium]|nr:(2Fe-2S)-binding protein [Pirellulales bacterium]